MARNKYRISCACGSSVIGTGPFFLWGYILSFMKTSLGDFNIALGFCLFFKKKKIKIVIQTLCISSSLGSIQRLRAPAMICLFFSTDVVSFHV